MIRTRGAQAALAVFVLASLLALSFQLATPKVQAEPGKKIVGYAAGWSVSGKAQAEALDGSKYTILIYAFLGVSGNSCTADWAELEYPPPPYVPVTISATKARDVFDGLKANKSENSNLKVMLSIGGGGYAGRFDAITDVNAFATSCYNIMTSWGADGLDLDYEFPAAGKQAHHLALVTALKGKLNSNGAGTGTHLLTVGAAASDYYGQTIDAYNVSTKIDYFTTMAYNYHGAWEGTVNYNSPLKDAACNDTSSSGLCAVSTAYYWNSIKQIPKSKLLIGVGYYGNKYTTSNGCSALGGGYGSITTIDYKSMREGGSLAILSGGTSANSGQGWQRTATTYDTYISKVHVCKSGEWIGYEDPDTVRARASWLNANGYPGIMIWEVFKDYNNEMINSICGVFTCPAGPTGPTSTPTRTYTSSTASATATRTRTATPDGGGGGGSCGGLPVWSSSTTYSANQQVQYNSVMYTAAWTTIGETPGASGAWRNDGPCPSTGATATRTRTNTVGGATATRTRTNTVGAATATRTRTNTTGTGYPAWAAGVNYALGARVSYAGLNYQASQGHVSQTGWEPPNVPAIWTRL